MADHSPNLHYLSLSLPSFSVRVVYRESLASALSRLNLPGALNQTQWFLRRVEWSSFVNDNELRLSHSVLLHGLGFRNDALF
jgi:hypothetical protein